MNAGYATLMSSYSALYATLRNGFFLVFPLLVILGNVELWLGSSSLTVPWVLIVLLPVALTELATLRRGRCAAELLPFLFLYLLLFALGIVAALVSSATGFTRNAVSLLPLCVALLTLFCFKDVRLPSDVPRVMRAAGGILALMIVYKSAWLFLPAWWESGIGGVFEQKSDMGLPLGKSNFLAVFLMFFSIFAWRSHKALWLLMLLAACLTLSRFGVAFVLLAAACVWLLNYCRLSTVVVSLGLVGVLLILPVWLFPVQISGMFHNSFLPASLAARFDLWAAALDLLNTHPFWGGGPGGFTTHLELVAWPRHEWGVHNFVLSQWIEFGVLGLLVYFMVIARFLLVRSSLPAADEALIKLGGVLLLFYGLFENVVGLAAFEVMFAYLLCLLSARRIV